MVQASGWATFWLRRAMDISAVLGSSVCRDLGQVLFSWCYVAAVDFWMNVPSPMSLGSEQQQETGGQIQRHFLHALCCSSCFQTAVETK